MLLKVMGERRVGLVLSLCRLTCLWFGSAAPHAGKGSGPTVFTSLWFTAEPVDTLVLRGAVALLSCSVHSGAPFRVQWRKDGTVLDLAGDARRRMQADGSLLVSSVLVSRDDQVEEGLYQCMASIPGLGTISSRYAQLSVTGLPVFSSQPEAVSVQRGHSGVMTCGVTSDLAALVRWERNREGLWLDRRVVQLDSGALLVSSATEADAGMYRCMLGNAPAAEASEEAELQVLTETEVEERLEFLRQPVPMTKVEGERVLLPCVVTGFPRPEVWWMLGNRRIDETAGRFEVVGGGSLQILSVTAEDAGMYRCVAKQGNDTIEAQAELTVHVPPRFLRKPVSVGAHEAASVLFQCEATGVPPPAIRWLKDGDTVIPSDYFRILRGGALQVQSVVQSDEGFFQCLAQNQAGNLQASAQLIILNHNISLIPGSGRVTAGFQGYAGPTPSAPRVVVAAMVSTRFIKLTWRAPAETHAGNDITYSIYYSQDGTNGERVATSGHAGALQVTVQNLQPDRKYVFRVAAQNQAGLGERSTPLTVCTQAEGSAGHDVDLYDLLHTPPPPAAEPAPVLHTPPPPAAEPAPVFPPVGVQASVLSTLPESLEVREERLYTVSWGTNVPDNTNIKTASTTSLSHVVSGLKPNTLHEFSVMVTRGGRSSTWSTTAQGTTFERKSGVMGVSDGHVMKVVVVSVGAFFIIIVIVVLVGGAFLCTRHSSSQQKWEQVVFRHKSSCKDLWIHHEHLDLEPNPVTPPPPRTPPTGGSPRPTTGPLDELSG